MLVGSFHKKRDRFAGHEYAREFQAARRLRRTSAVVMPAAARPITPATGAMLRVSSPALGSAFSSDPQVARLSGQMLRIVSVAEPLFSMSTVMSGALRGAGEAKYPFYVGVVCMLCIRVSLGALMLFGFGMGLSAVWIAMAVDLNLRGIANYLRFVRGKWIPAFEK